MSSYTINPCDACIQRYKKSGCNINNISSCCYETLGAFMGSDNSLQIANTPQGKNAFDCVKNKIIAMGQSPCELKIAPRPILQRAPHYFPDLLEKTNNKEESKKQCIQMCQNTQYKNECILNCLTDYASVFEKTSSSSREKENYHYYGDKSKKPKYTTGQAILIIILTIALSFLIVYGGCLLINKQFK